MARQQKISDPLHDIILVPTVPADQLPLVHFGFQQQRVQLPQRFLPGVLWLRFRQGSEAQLRRRDEERGPLDAGEDVGDEGRVIGELGPQEGRGLEVQGEGGVGALAGFHGAGYEVCWE